MALISAESVLQAYLVEIGTAVRDFDVGVRNVLVTTAEVKRFTRAEAVTEAQVFPGLVAGNRCAPMPPSRYAPRRPLACTRNTGVRLISVRLSLWPGAVSRRHRATPRSETAQVRVFALQPASGPLPLRTDAQQVAMAALSGNNCETIHGAGRLDTA